jgi:hypothetical protein
MLINDQSDSSRLQRVVSGSSPCRGSKRRGREWHRSLHGCSLADWGSQLLDKSVEPHWRISVNVLGLRALPIILQPVTA